MELNIYDIIKKTVTTPKSVSIYGNLGKITFEVNKHANKIMVKQAVEKIWDVKVANVNIVNLKGKKKTFARKSFETSGVKKAIVSLKKGYKIDLPGHFETMGASGGESGKPETSEVK